jgi:DNA-binding CsgD family transcriptional regulator
VKIPNFGLVKVVLDASHSVVERSNFYFDSLQMLNPDLRLEKDGLYLVEDGMVFLFDEDTQSFKSHQSLKREQTQGISLDSTYSFALVDGGFRLSQKSMNDSQPGEAPILIRSISSIEGNQCVRVSNQQIPSLSAEHCLIEAVVPQYGDAQFRFQLDDSKEWVTWNEQGHIQLFNLEPGSHRLMLEANYGDGHQAQHLFEFSIVAPWYFSAWAISLYVLIAIALVALMYYLQSKVRKRKEKRMKEQWFASKKQDAWREERQSMLMEKKNLEKEVSELEQKVKDKSVELAKKAKESDDKNKILDQLKAKLMQWKSAKGASKEVSEMLRLIDNFIQLDDKTFEIQIDELQQDFYKSLKEAYPDLSTYDLRLCAYVKLGLSSKEIAQIQGVLPSSVNVSRSRLRKKLNLDTGDDLFDTLNQF